MCSVHQYTHIQLYRRQYIFQRRTGHLSTCAPSISKLTSRQIEGSTQSKEGQDSSVHVLRPSGALLNSTLGFRYTDGSTQSRDGQDTSVHVLRPAVRSYLGIQKLVHSLKQDRTLQCMCFIQQCARIQVYRRLYIVLSRTGHFSTCAPSNSTLTSRYKEGSTQS